MLNASVATMLMAALLAQEPADTLVPPPPEESTEKKPEPPAAPQHGPAPDAQDLTDSPRAVVVEAPKHNTVVSFENDAVGFFTHAVVAAVPAALLGAIPAAFLAGVLGTGTVALSLVSGPLLAVATGCPVAAGVCLMPACLVAAGGSCVASLASQTFSSRKGALLPSLAAAAVVTTLSLMLVVLPVFIASGVVGVTTLLVPSSPVRAGWEVPDVSGRDGALRTALITLAVGHPVLAAGWLLLGTALAAAAGGVASALTYRWTGRPLEPGEGSSVDMFGVDPPPGDVVAPPPGNPPPLKKKKTRATAY